MCAGSAGNWLFDHAVFSCDEKSLLFCGLLWPMHQACCPVLLSSQLCATAFGALLLLACINRPCPTGLVTSNNTAQYPNSSKYWRDNGDGTRGFTSELACVTQDGWGYASRLANQCPVGSYNPRDTYAPCTACPTGRTTAAVGAGATLADCGIAAGYGAVNGAVAQCPVGEYVL